MKSILRATAILGGSSLISIVVGLLSSKAWALFLGPSGLGLLGLLQSLMGLCSMIAGMGVSVALTKIGAAVLAQDASQVSQGQTKIGSALLARDAPQRFASLRRAAWLLVLGAGIVLLILLVVLRVPVSSWMLGGPEHALSAALIGIALLFNLAYNLEVGTLNACHRVGSLAKVAVLNSVLGTGAIILVVWRWHDRALAAALIAGSVVGWMAARWFVNKDTPRSKGCASVAHVRDASRSLLRFGLPYTASLLVGTGVQLLLPVLVVHKLGTAGVGLYKAATAVSVGYLGFLLAAMGQDYFPRVSAISDQPEGLIKLVNQQHRLIMLLGTPMILGVLALAPYLVPLIYSAKFSPAVDVLEWQLIGDLFKFSSWTMSFIVLTRMGSSTFFWTELIGGLTTLSASWIAMQYWGLTGLGIAFLVTYIVYYLVVWVIVRRDIGLVWTLENKRMMWAAIAAVAVIRSLPAVGLLRYRTPVALALALIAGCASLKTIWGEVGGLRPGRR